MLFQLFFGGAALEGSCRRAAGFAAGLAAAGLLALASAGSPPATTGTFGRLASWLESADASAPSVLPPPPAAAALAAGAGAGAGAAGELRTAGQTGSERFGQLHGLATLLYGVNCLLGLVLVVIRQEKHNP